MTTRIVPFEIEHYDRMGDTRIPTYHDLFSVDYRAILAGFRAAGEAWSVIADDGDVLAFGGVVKLWEGTGEAWSVVSARAKEFPLAVCKASRAAVRGARLRRVQACVRAGDETARRFAELCGLDAEATLRAFGPDGEDYIMYARIRP
jgi:hypothetical protein